MPWSRARRGPAVWLPRPSDQRSLGAGPGRRVVARGLGILNEGTWIAGVEARGRGSQPCLADLCAPASPQSTRVAGRRLRWDVRGRPPTAPRPVALRLAPSAAARAAMVQEQQQGIPAWRASRLDQVTDTAGKKLASLLSHNKLNSNQDFLTLRLCPICSTFDHAPGSRGTQHRIVTMEGQLSLQGPLGRAYSIQSPWLVSKPVLQWRWLSLLIVTLSEGQFNRMGPMA